MTRRAIDFERHETVQPLTLSVRRVIPGLRKVGSVRNAFAIMAKADRCVISATSLARLALTRSKITILMQLQILQRRHHLHQPATWVRSIAIGGLESIA